VRVKRSNDDSGRQEKYNMLGRGMNITNFLFNNLIKVINSLYIFRLLDKNSTYLEPDNWKQNLKGPAASILKTEITLYQKYQSGSTKALAPFTKLYGITPQNTAIFIVINMSFRYLTSLDLLQFYGVGHSWYLYYTSEE
jgi:hypothetical protein